jgi:EmrB/QacA subfamily drug resistance transporter
MADTTSGSMIHDKSLQRNVLIVAVLSSFLTPFMASSVVVSLPSMGRDLSMNVLTLSWVSTAYLLAAAGFSVPFGRASDIYGRKKIFLWGILLDICSSLIGAFAVSNKMLIAARFLQGIGGAMIFTLGITIISSVFPVEKRGRAIGITIAAVYCGLSAGPFIGGFLTHQLGWRSIFLLNVLIGLVIVVTTLWKLKPEWAGARGESFDLLGSVIYVLSLSCTMYGLSRIPAAYAFLLVGAGVAGLIVFAFWEIRTEHPVLEMRLFLKSRTFLFSNLAALINYSATFAITFLLSLFLQYVRGFSAQAAGLILVSQPVVMALFSPFAGRLSDRLDARVVASVGMSITVVGLATLIFLHPSSGLPHIVGNLMFLGLGFALFSSPNTNAVMSSVERKYLGVASGTLATMRVTGQMASMGVVMIVLALFGMGQVVITPAYYGTFLHTMRTAFTIFALFCLAGVFASLARGRNESTAK